MENIGEGSWYFHLQARNANGWGGISHFLFQIDTEKPDYFKLKEIVRSDLTEPQAKFSFEAADKTSGIDHYEIQIDDQPAQNWGLTGDYQTPILNPGKHIIIAKAVDKAGNERIAMLPPKYPLKWYEQPLIWVIIIILAGVIFYSIRRFLWRKLYTKIHK